jgi:hypothetical protein
MISSTALQQRYKSVVVISTCLFECSTNTSMCQRSLRLMRKLHVACVSIEGVYKG